MTKLQLTLLEWYERNIEPLEAQLALYKEQNAQLVERAQHNANKAQEYQAQLAQAAKDRDAQHENAILRQRVGELEEEVRLVSEQRDSLLCRPCGGCRRWRARLGLE